MRACLKTLLLLFCPLCLLAQQLTFAPAFRNYSTEQGLPNNWVFGILQDRAGYIWVSTHHGVCRFNGYEFEQFPDTLSTNYTSVLSKAMAEDGHGRLWYVDFPGRVFCVENGVIHPYRYNDVIAAQKPAFDIMHALITNEAGNEFWLFATNYGVLHIWGEGKWERIQPPASCFTQIFEQSEKWQHNNFATGRGFFPRYPPSIAFQNGTRSVIVDNLPWPAKEWVKGWNGYIFSHRLRDGSWLLFLNSFLYCLDKDYRLLWMYPYGNRPNSVLEDHTGSILLGLLDNKGLEKYHSLDDLQANKLEASYLPGLTVSALLQDREGGYWIGTQEEGVFYCPAWDAGMLVNSPLLERENVRSVVTDGGNRLFAGLANSKIFEITVNDGHIGDITPPYLDRITRLSFDNESGVLSVAGAPPNFFQSEKWVGPVFFDPWHGTSIKSYGGGYWC